MFNIVSIREMQIKITTRYRYISIGMAKIKIPTLSRSREEAE